MLQDVVNGLETLGDVGENTIVLTVWGAKWVKHVWDFWRLGGSAGQFAADALKTLDEVDDEPEDFIEEHVTEHRKRVRDVDGVRTIFDNVKTTKRLRKGKRSCFAAALAKQAYLKFGERSMSEANILVTRKWLAKLLTEDMYKDLRTCDKTIAIDRALFLSFVPTKEFGMMKLAVASRPWEKRVLENNSFPGFFGRVFGVGKFPATEDFSH
jgi:hypothetical protein